MVAFGADKTKKIPYCKRKLLNCPRLCRQYKKTLVDVENKIVKQQTDFVFQTESVLFLFEYDSYCRSLCIQL